jgi:cardiolipin synthase
MSASSGLAWQWLRTGDEMFAAMLAAIDAAQTSLALESYIYAAAGPGLRVREALVRAARRGARVRVLVDALGSYSLPADFWSPLRAAGGEARSFNPISLNRLGIRNHRKLLVVDDRVAFVGGFNLAPEYEGDGVTRGWCDLGMKLEGALVAELGASFDEMFERADFQHKRLARLRRDNTKREVEQAEQTLLLSGPCRGRNPIQRALLADLRPARRVDLIVPYFLPSLRFRRAITRVARRGGTVRLLLPAKSDVTLSRLAGQSLYRRLLRAGVEIYEYQPQVLHAKLFLVDNAVYLGSSNLDPRSLRINYELMLRFEQPTLVAEAREIFTATLAHTRRVELEAWQQSRSFWTRLKQRWAYYVLARLDPLIARRQWRALPD